MSRFELHFATNRNGAPAIHVAGCAHGRPRKVMVQELEGETLADALNDDLVTDHNENNGHDQRYTVKVAPCALEDLTVTHKEHSARAKVATPCTVVHLSFGGRCLNCGFDPHAGYIDPARVTPTSQYYVTGMQPVRS